MKRNLLIVGKMPPPIGGVTMYNKRLTKALKDREINLKLINLNGPDGNLLKFFFQSRIIHLSLSNSYIKFFLIIISKLFLKKVVTTLHGSFGRFSKLRNVVEILSIRLSDKTLLLNEKTFNELEYLDSKVALSSTNFDLFNEELSIDIIDRIEGLKKRCRFVFCTNSWKLTFDKKGNEIYSISKLVKFFGRQDEFGLIISDPSGTNKEYIDSLNISFGNNIEFITKDHPFSEVLKLSNGFIRATTTDGDALSVRESLKLNIPVFASDVVDRPIGCILFSLDSIDDLYNELIQVNDLNFNIVENSSEFINELIEIYKSLRIKKNETNPPIL